MKTLITVLVLLSSISSFAGESEHKCGDNLNKDIFEQSTNYDYLMQNKQFSKEEVSSIAEEMMPDALLCYEIEDIDGILILNSYFTGFQETHRKIRTFFRN